MSEAPKGGPESILKINPIIEKFKEKVDATFFDRPGGGINQKGRQFINQDLFDDLYTSHDRDLGGIQQEIDEARETYTGFHGQQLLNFLQARLNYQIAWQAAQVENGRAWTASSMSSEQILTAAQSYRGRYNPETTNEDFLESLKTDYSILLERETGIIAEEITRERSASRKEVAPPEMIPPVPADIPEGNLPNWYLRSERKRSAKPARSIDLWTTDNRGRRRKINLKKVAGGAVLSAAVILLLKVMNQEGKVDAIQVDPIIEPPQTADTYSGVVDTAAAGKAEKMGQASAVPIRGTAVQAELDLLVSGAPTVYDRGVWEQVLDRRLRGTWTNKGIKDKEKYYPPLNRELNDNPKIASLIKNHQVIAVNPADFNLEYRQLSQRLLTSAKKQGLSEEATARTLNTNPGLRKMAENLIGQIVYVKLPDGSLKEMVIMDTASNWDASRLSSVNSRFIADFDPDFLKRELSLEWVPPTKDRPGYFRDLKTGQQATSLPDVSLLS